MTATIDNTTRLEPAPQARPGRRRWLGFAAVLSAMILNLLDTTIVNIAGPSVRADLGGGLSSLQWMAAGYTLAMAVGLLTGGRLGDLFGRRRMLLVGLTGFLISSLSCGLATSMGLLIGARVVQGLFAAVMVPQAFGLIRDLFPPQEIGKAFAALGPAIGLSTVAGPVVAGGLVQADLFGLGWRAIFLINLPLGAFALITGLRTLPAGPVTDRPRAGLDLAGVLIAGTGMFLLVYPLVQGRELGWPGWVFWMLATAAPVLAGFGWQQSRRVRTGRSPLVELSVLRRRSYASGVLFTLVFFGTVAGFSLTIGLFLQVGLGYSAIRASLPMASWAVGAFFGSGFAAAMMARLGRRVLQLGLVVMAAGGVALWSALGHAARVPGFWDLAPSLALFGLGMGAIFVPLFDIIMAEVEDHEVGSAAGLLETVQQLAGSLGVAVLATVFFSRFGTVGHVEAARTAVLISIGLTVLAFAIAFLLPHKPRTTSH